MESGSGEVHSGGPENCPFDSRRLEGTDCAQKAWRYPPMLPTMARGSGGSHAIVRTSTLSLETESFSQRLQMGTDPAGAVKLAPFSYALEKYDSDKDGK